MAEGRDFDPTKPYIAQWKTAMTGNMTPTETNPNVARWVQAARGIPGMNPAASAAMQQRAKMAGGGMLARVAPDYWQRLMSAALGFAQDRESLPARQNVYASSLQGAFSGFGTGGMNGMGG